MLLAVLLLTYFATLTTVLIKIFKPVLPVTPACVPQLTQYDYTLVKKYSALFGLDNEVEVDVQVILDMGRKYEEYLGTATIDSLIEQHEYFYAPLYHVRSAVTGGCINKPRRHCINKMIKGREVLVHITCLAHTIFIQIITGGNKDGEPSSSLY